MNVAPVGKPDALYVKMSPGFGSVALATNLTVSRSAFVIAGIAVNVGFKFVFVMVMTAFVLSVSWPSETRNFTVYVPFCPRAGTQKKLRVAAVKVAPVGKPEALYVKTSPGFGSVALTTNLTVSSSAFVIAGIEVKVGFWF